jgi:hypothetical protein
MTRLEIKQRLFNQFKNDFDIEDFFDQHGEATQPFESGCYFEYQDEDNGWHDALMEVVGVVYMRTGQQEYQNPIGYGVPENVSDGNTIDDWEIVSVGIFIDGKDITKTEDLQTLGKLLD